MVGVSRQYMSGSLMRGTWTVLAGMHESRPGDVQPVALRVAAQLPDDQLRGQRFDALDKTQAQS